MISLNAKNKVWAVLPLKGLIGAKNRLSNILSNEERVALVKAMAKDMLCALTKANNLAGVVVISESEDIKKLVKEYPVEIISQGKEKGLSGAISHASSILADRGIESMLVIHGDIPLVKPEDIDAIIEAALPAPSVTITPHSPRGGTNVMVCSPPNVIPFQYGNNSFSKHQKLARDNGVNLSEFTNDRLAIDIDTADDLRDLVNRLSGGEIGLNTRNFLLETGLASRLN